MPAVSNISDILETLEAHSRIRDLIYLRQRLRSSQKKCRNLDIFYYITWHRTSRESFIFAFFILLYFSLTDGVMIPCQGKVPEIL